MATIVKISSGSWKTVIRKAVAHHHQDISPEKRRGRLVWGLRSFRRKSLAKLLQFLVELIRLAEFEKIAIASMQPNNLARVLDRTKVLLGSGDDFADICNQSRAIRAIVAMKLLEKIQVFQIAAVKHNEVAALDLVNSIDRETCGLIKADAQIRHRQWDDHAVNDRSGDKVQWAVRNKPTKESHLQFSVRLFDGFLEFNPLALYLKKHAALLLVQNGLQFTFQGSHLLQQ